MAKLYYGGGSTTIQGSDIRGIQLSFRGAIEIEDKTSDSFVITHQKQGIMIFPIGEGTLNELFDYTVEFIKTSVTVADSDAKRVPTTIHKVMDYVELMNTNAEDMTTKSEDLNATYTHGSKVAKTLLKQPNLNNQNTSNYNTELYLEDGSKFDGYYHLHLANNSAMTGKEHSEDSQDLYFNNGKPTKNPSLVPYVAIEQFRKKQILKRNRRIY